MEEQAPTTEQVSPSLPIKGIRDGLLVTAGHLPAAEIADKVTAALEAQRAFFAGSRIVVDVGARRLSRGQLSALLRQMEALELELWAVLSSVTATRDVARELGLATRVPGSLTDLDGNALSDAAVMAQLNDGGTPETAPPEANTLLVQETLRSGRSIFHEGHVVVLGDVNPGAEIIAGGNVIVWGHLRGLVQAGSLGDHGAIVCALDLSPTQLRIADQIAVTPSARRRGDVEPEQASIQDGQIVAELWTARERM